MDGSASSFVYLLQQSGVEEQDAPRKFIRVLKDVEVRQGSGANEKWARLSPFDGYKLDFFIEFNHPAVDGTTQRAVVDFGDITYVRDVARARTFGFMQDVESLRGLGLARGGSLENAIVIGDTGVLNALRFEDEFVRHKILDVIGDMALVGHPIVGHLVAHRGGHALHTAFAAHVLEETEAWTLVESGATVAAEPAVPVPVNEAVRVN